MKRPALIVGLAALIFGLIPAMGASASSDAKVRQHFSFDFPAGAECPGFPTHLYTVTDQVFRQGPHGTGIISLNYTSVRLTNTSNGKSIFRILHGTLVSYPDGHLSASGFWMFAVKTSGGSTRALLIDGRFSLHQDSTLYDVHPHTSVVNACALIA